MSGSAICFTENPKITAASRNMHITGNEKTLAAKLVQAGLAADVTFSNGEYGAVRNDRLSYLTGMICGSRHCGRRI